MKAPRQQHYQANLEMADTRFSTPFWLMRRYKEKRLELKEAEVAKVKLAFELALSGVSTARIAERVAQLEKLNRPWNAKAIERLLKNRRVLGFVIGPHIAPAVVSEVDFAKTQVALELRQPGRKA